jgi:hypothetical protein
LSLLVALLGFGLAGCYFGKSGLNRVRGWHTWEQVPPEWREWLNSVVPPERQHADHGAFPTEYAPRLGYESSLTDMQYRLCGTYTNRFRVSAAK